MSEQNGEWLQQYSHRMPQKTSYMQYYCTNEVQQYSYSAVYYLDLRGGAQKLHKSKSLSRIVVAIP